MKSLNSTFIVMVPKKEGADDPKLEHFPVRKKTKAIWRAALLLIWAI